MTKEASRPTKLGELIKDEIFSEHGYCRKTVTANEASAESYEIGHVLGEVTANGKYKISVNTAADGSEDAAAICIENKSIPATTDTDVVVLYRGPAVVGKDTLVFDASYDTAAEKQAAYDLFEAAGILVGEQV